MSTTAELLSTTDASHVLRKSVDTVRAWARSGRLPAAVVLNSGVRLFDRAVVERMAAEQRK